MKRKILAVMLTAVMASSILAGCGGGSKGVEGDVVTIGVFEPKTGENGSGVAQEELGIEYANYVRPTVTVGGKE